MTQENQPDSTETTDFTSNSDVLLMAIVRFGQFLNVNIILFVKGAIIGGVLISEKEYFENLKKSGNINFSDQLQDGFNKVLDRIQSLSTENPDNQVEVPIFTDIEYIHLKNVKIHSANITTPNSAGFYWRGRLSSIDGFNLL